MSSRQSPRPTLRTQRFLQLQPEEVVRGKESAVRKVERKASPRSGRPNDSARVQSVSERLQEKRTESTQIHETTEYGDLQACKRIINDQSLEIKILYEQLERNKSGGVGISMDELLSLKRSNRLLEFELDEMTTKLDFENKKHRELEESLRIERERSDKLTKHNAELLELIRKLEGRITQVEDRAKPHAIHSDIMGQLEESKRKCEFLEQSNRDKLQKIAELEEKMGLLQKSADSYRNSLLKVQANKPVRIQISRDEDADGTLDKEIQLLTAEWNEKVIALREKLDIRDRDVEELIHELEKRDKEIESLHQDNVFLSSKIDAKERKVDELRQQLLLLDESLSKEKAYSEGLLQMLDQTGSE